MSANQNCSAVYAPGTDSRPSKIKEHARDLSEAYVLALEKIDKKLGQTVRNLILPQIARWELDSREDTR